MELLTVACPSPSCCGHVEGDETEDNIASFCVSLSAFQLNKYDFNKRKACSVRAGTANSAVRNETGAILARISLAVVCIYSQMMLRANRVAE